MKTKVLLYCTKAKPYLMQGIAKPMHSKDLTNPFNFYWRLSTKKMASAFTPDYSGKIVARCEVECDEFEFNTMSRDIFSYWYTNGHEVDYDKMCLTYDDLWDYLGDNNGYAYFITNLKAFDKPLKFSEASVKKECKNCSQKHLHLKCLAFKEAVVKPNCCFHSLSKSSQNMCWVWYEGEKYLWLPCKPKELCYLFNGDASALVRKKILKGM